MLILRVLCVLAMSASVLSAPLSAALLLYAYSEMPGYEWLGINTGFMGFLLWVSWIIFVTCLFMFAHAFDAYLIDRIRYRNELREKVPVPNNGGLLLPRLMFAWVILVFSIIIVVIGNSLLVSQFPEHTGFIISITKPIAINLAILLGANTIAIVIIGAKRALGV